MCACNLFGLSSNWKMASTKLSTFLFFQVLFLIPFALDLSHAFHVRPSNVTDEESLLAFKSAITFDPFHSLDNWTPNISFCNWTGVWCSDRHQRVVSLNLSNMALQGNISPFLGNLSFLNSLDLANNSLGGHIPNQLGSLPRLSKLYLFLNELKGSIPTTLSACRSLREISLSKNYLTENMPSQLGSLPNLEFLQFRRNNLMGTIPSSLGNISSLEFLDLSENNLHGRIPWELGRLNRLSKFSLSENHLTGEIPSFLSNCTALQILILVDNHLTGEIPGKFCSMNSGLIELYLGINKLSGRIPITLCNCTELQILELSENQLSGIMPLSLGKLSKLTWLNLEYNQFVSDNTRSFPILNSLTNCSLMEFIGLDHNNLEGVIPSSVGDLSPKLSELDLSENEIRGKIPPQIGNLTSLTRLNLSTNLFTGVIPFTITMLQNLEQLDLSRNSLEGNIPTNISQLESLGLLDFSQNKLSGNIPSFLAHLQNLRRLYLHHNQFMRDIPTSLSRCWRLEVLDLSYNKLSGHIPPQVAGLSNIAFYFNLSNNLLKGPLPLELSIMDKVQAIDISANQLTGHIPNALVNCIELEYLNVSSNQMEGPIPDSFGKLQNLKDLDLSFNNLSSKIPVSLGKLKLLHHLNFSMNNLSGEVPKDGIFKKLGPASFSGNLGLCGPWVKLPACTTSKHKNHRHLKHVILPIVVITTLVVWCLFMGFLWRKYCNKCLKDVGPLKVGHPRISLSELLTATAHFSETNLLGVGSFGKVYKGVLQDGTMVAVKVLDLQNEDALKCFARECNILSRVRHRNLIRVITSYSDMDFKALIFPLMQNGSLDRFLYPEDAESSQGQVCNLDLIQRLNIAIDIAQGVEYLHHHCFVQVIHCDLKPSNVLLGEDMTAYVTDFGISKLIIENFKGPYSCTHVLKGSIGYIAPEYGINRGVTTKGDVYSFGIVLLEMVTRKRPTDSMFVVGMNLPKWVNRSFPNTIAEIVDGHLLTDAATNKEDRVFSCIKQLINVGLLCTKESPEERPNMNNIVRILHNIRDTFLGIVPRTPFQIDRSYLIGSTSAVGKEDESQSSSF